MDIASIVLIISSLFFFFFIYLFILLIESSFNCWFYSYFYVRFCTVKYRRVYISSFLRCYTSQKEKIEVQKKIYRFIKKNNTYTTNIIIRVEILIVRR